MPRHFGIKSIHSFDAQQARVLFMVLGQSYLARDQVTWPQVEAPDLRGGNVDIQRTRQESLSTQEAKPVRNGIQYTGPKESSLLIGNDLLRSRGPVLVFNGVSIGLCK